MTIRYIAGPLIGAVIGYFTNYIAVKMLFYPRTEKYLFGHKLPLTPGAIPKGKGRLAKAIGEAVGQQLLTGDDIRARLMQPALTERLADRMLQTTEYSLEELGRKCMKEEDYEAVSGKLRDVIANEIFMAIQKFPIADIIIEKGSAVIKERFAGTMVAMFLNDEMINAVAGPVGAEIEAYINENGKAYIEQEIAARSTELAKEPISKLADQFEANPQKLKEMIISIYQSLIDQGLPKLMDELNISSMVETKINEMDIEELEELVMSVMKKELNTIVNLGALIGFVLGLINLLF